MMRQMRCGTMRWMGFLALASLVLVGCPKRPEVFTPALSGGASAPASGATTAGGPASAESKVGESSGQGAGLPGTGSAGAPGSSAGTSSGTASTAAAGAAGTAGSSSPGSGGTGPAGAGTETSSTGAAAEGQSASLATGTTLPNVPSPGEYVEASALRDIHFDFDRADIRSGDEAVLAISAAWLKTNAQALLLIEGHCDERGTNEYNLALGDRRAKAARDYLLSAGIDAARITLISYGKERPLCTDRSEVCWARDRRARFLVKP